VVEKLESDLLQYIVESKKQPGDKLSSLDELSTELKISTGKLREQLEVARSLGLVDVKPKIGIKLAPYDFFPAVQLSLLYAVAQDPALFEEFSDLRDNVESGFFRDAVAKLTAEDHGLLQDLVERAWQKLNDGAVHIPHKEHRELHMTIFSRLGNPFVQGLLEAYWEAYEALGFTLISDYDYLRRVWNYHERIVKAIAAGEIEEAYQLQVEHTKLRPHKERRAHNGARRRSYR
jgi:DNA-binding FadR family transcriptional regulator